MNDLATPPSSAGLIDRLAGMAEGLRRGLEEDVGAGLGDVLFVMIAVHCLMRFASLYLRWKAGWLTPRRRDVAPPGPSAPARDRTDPHATPLPASPIEALLIQTGGAAPRAARENFGGERAGGGDAGATQVPDAGGAPVTVISLSLALPGAPADSVVRGTPPGRPCAAGVALVVRARASALFDGSGHGRLRTSLMLLNRNELARPRAAPVGRRRSPRVALFRSAAQALASRRKSA